MGCRGGSEVDSAVGSGGSNSNSRTEADNSAVGSLSSGGLQAPGLVRSCC